jgi:uncharacterized protein (TIGR00255 family)
MTGFGKAEGQAGQKKFTVEIRSLNSKQLDLNLRMPGIYREKELELRSFLGESILRGKADTLLYYESLEAEKRNSINAHLLGAYYQDLKAVVEQTGMPEPDFLNALMRIPDIMKPENPALDEEEWKSVRQLVEAAFLRFDEYRLQEGKKMHAEFRLRIQNIMALRESLDQPIQQRGRRTREKLMNNLQELIPPDKIDPNRFEQELIYYLERLDVSEEYQRLLANCEHFLEELDGEGQGKKLGFVSQEIGREINTIGSKANDSDMQRIVVLMKDELEKIKEQINNVL